MTAGHHPQPAAGDDGPDRDRPVLLSGGNPQIAKGDGDAPVRAYLEASPGWKGVVVTRLDGLVEAAIPDVRKAVRWNSPFYGIADQGWFLSFHLMTRYVKVSFLNGAHLTPPPPIAATDPEVRYLHIGERDDLDADRFTDWVIQASAQPGNRLF